MALFGSKSTKTTVNTIRPTVVRTQNVAKEIQSVAKRYDVQVEKLDFNILDVSTYTRMNDGTKETEWEEVHERDLYELDDTSALLNPFFEIKQTYEIEIFTPTKDSYIPCKNLKMAVGANASKCKVYVSISAGSVIEFHQNLENDLKSLINKRKIRAGILIGIFDEMVGEATSKIYAVARVDEKIVYKKNETLLVAEGIEPTATTNDALILHYEKNNDVDENEKVDYASRGFIQSVKKDELLIEYIKAKPGSPGRNCRGEFMKPSEPIVANEVKFGVDDSIRVIEDDYSIKYYANENGYIAFENKTYLIKTDVEVGEISFKTTGSINSGVDSDVSINVSEADAIKDAIGTGMSVEVSEIDIDGNVGSNARVVALKAKVGGQTHKTAFIKADDLDINVHKGIAVGDEVRITRLEHGEVKGRNVRISQALGGKIEAENVELNICTSHVKVTASRKIEIQKLQGSENTFTIDPIIRKEEKSSHDDETSDESTLKQSVKELAQELKKYRILVKEGTPAFLDIKKRLMHYKKSGVKLPAAFVKKYKQFQQMQERLKEIEEEFNVKNNQLKTQTNKVVSMQDSITDARVINRDRWVGYNEIRFKLIEPPIELVHKPAEGSRDMIFGLVEVEEGEFEIQAVSE